MLLILKNKIMKMKKLHQHLSDNLSWYKHWHETGFHKIIHYGILGFAILFTVGTILSATTASAVGTIYYVSASGSDSNNGTSISTPWQTIAKVNATTFVAGDKILFNSGDTFTGTIIPSASGTSTNPITYGAYGSGAKPVITGFVNVSGWTSLGGNKWESAALSSAFPDINILSVNGGNYAKGRTPDTGYWPSTSATYTKSSNVGTITDTANLNASSINWKDAQVVFRSQRWVLDKATITAASTNKITFNGEPSTTPGWGYFIQNDPRTLNLVNEWSYNPTSKQITIYSTSTPTNVKAPAIDVAVNLNSKDYITFDGIDFTGFNSTGINTTSKTGITVTNSAFNFIGIDAIYAYPNSINLKVTNNTFNEINSRGIHGGSSDNAFISNNTLNKIGNLAGMGSNGDDSYTGIISMGDNGIVSFNSITNAGYVGIRWDGKSSQILKNFVDTTNYIKDDGGGIYSYPQQDGTAYTTRYHGFQRTVANNIVMNSIGAVAGGEPSSSYSQGEGIYADGLSPNINFTNNTIYKAKLGLFINGGHEITASGNTVYDTERGINFMAIPDKNGVQQRAHDVSLQSNILVARESSLYTEYPIYLELKAPTLATWMDGFLANNNVYARVRPANDPKLIWLDVSGPADVFKSLSEWRLFSSQDSNATESPVALTTSTNLRFEYNASSAPKVVSLTEKYVDMKNVDQTCTLTIPAWSSVVMIKTGTTCTSNGDPTPPSTSLTSPTTGTTVLGTTQQVAANATDNVGVTKVEFYIDGTTTLLNCTPNPDTTSPYLCIWNTTTVSNGTHTITSKAYDAAGNSAISSVVSVNVQNVVTDTTAPVFTPTGALSSPSANLSVPVGTSYDITAHATDNVGMAKVEFYKDGVLINTQTSGPNSDFTYSWNTIGLTVGSTHSWTAKAYDTASPANVSTTTARVITIGAGADTTPPTASITNAGGYYKGGTRMTLKATSSDNVGVTKTEFYVNDVKKCTDTTSPYTCSWSMPSSTTVTSYVIKAKAYDAAGNVGTSADVKMTNRKIAELSVLADAGPNQTITLPTNSVTLTGSYSTNTLTTTTTWSKVSGSGTITSPTSTTTTVTGLTAGTSVFQFTVDNGAGFTTSATVTVVVNVAVNTVVFSFSAPQDPTKLGPLPNENSGTVTTIQVNASGTNPITKVDFYVDGNLVGTDNTSNPFGTVWDTTTVSNGAHLFTAKATDNLGNTGTSAAISVTISN